MPKSKTVAPAAPRPASEPLWLDQQAAAAYLDVTPRTIRNYIARGTLPARRIKGSRAIRISRADLDQLLQPIPSAEVGR